MASPFAVGTVSTFQGTSYGSPQRAMVILCDGSILASRQSAVGTVKLAICTNPTAATPTWSDLSQTFSIASCTTIVHDLYTPPSQFGAATCDVWLVIGPNDGVNGADCVVAHATYTASGNSWSWDNTGTNAAALAVSGFCFPSIMWNGTDLIVCFRDGSGTTRSVQVTYTTTKNGSSGWVAKASIGSSTTMSAHAAPLLRHGPNLGCGGAAGTILIYCKNSGANTDNLAARVLLDSAASAAVANWGAEALAGASGQNNIYSTACTVDPNRGLVHVTYSSTIAGTGGAAGTSWVAIYVNGTTVTWGTRESVNTTSTDTMTAIGVDMQARAYCAIETNTPGTSGVINYSYADPPYTSWHAAAATVFQTSGDGNPHFPADVALSSYIPMIGQRGTSTFTEEFDNTLTAQSGLVGLTETTWTQYGISGGPPGNGGAETQVAWTDVNGNGHAGGAIPTYGGGVEATRYEIDAWVYTPNQNSLTTSSPDGRWHVLAQTTGAVFSGSEDPTYTLSEIAPTGTVVGRYLDTGTNTPATGPALEYRVRAMFHPGEPGLVFIRCDITNPSGSAVTLAASDSLEVAYIGGLTQLSQGGSAAWAAANGLYGSVGGSESAWPSSLTSVNPDYVYITPTSASGLKDSVIGVRKTGLVEAIGVGFTLAQIEYLVDSNRLKFKLQGTYATFPGSTTYTLYFIQAYRRNLAAGEAASLAADLLNPDTSGAFSVGTFSSYSYDEGRYVVGAAANQVEVTHTFPTNVTVRWHLAYHLTGYTAATVPVVTLAGVRLVQGTDYVGYVDTINQVAYVQFLFDLVASGATGSQKNNGLLVFEPSVPMGNWSAGIAALAGAHW